MFNSVKSIALATGVSLAALSSAAFADEKVAFSAIDVSSSIDAAQDANNGDKHILHVAARQII